CVSSHNIQRLRARSWGGGHMLRLFISVAMAAVLCSCATKYEPSGLTGGFTSLELRPDVWRVSFSGNGHTTNETAQTYWLYRCAELALEKNYDGFEILSDMRFVARTPPSEGGGPLGAGV